MKKTLKYIIYLILFNKVVFAQNIDISITPLLSTSKYTMNFTEVLNYGIKQIDKHSLFPKLSFGYDFKPGIKISIRYKNFSWENKFYLNNFLMGPIPTTLQYDGSRKPSFHLILDENHQYIRTKKIIKSLTNNENHSKFSYKIQTNISLYANYSNYILNIPENSKQGNVEGHDSTAFDLYENINQIGIGSEYKLKIQEYFVLYLSATINYIFNFKSVSLENFGSYYITHNYNGYGTTLGLKLVWNSIFFSYQYLKMQTEKNYFSNSSHKFEIGISLQALSIDPKKLFGN